VIKYVLNKRPDILAKDNDNESALFYGRDFFLNSISFDLKAFNNHY